jgi:hypothetical protein
MLGGVASAKQLTQSISCKINESSGEGYSHYIFLIDLSKNLVQMQKRGSKGPSYPEYDVTFQIVKKEDSKIYFHIMEDNTKVESLKWIDLVKLQYAGDKDHYAQYYSIHPILKKHPPGSLNANLLTQINYCNKIISNQEQTKNLKNECNNLGFKIGTEANGNCVLKLMEIRKTSNSPGTIIIQNTDNNDAAVEQMKRANEIEKNKVLLGISEKLLTKPQSNSTNCRSTVIGNTVNTNCN